MKALTTAESAPVAVFAVSIGTASLLSTYFLTQCFCAHSCFRWSIRGLD
jgi:hypothetical protein